MTATAKVIVLTTRKTTLMVKRDHAASAWFVQSMPIRQTRTRLSAHRVSVATETETEKVISSEKAISSEVATSKEVAISRMVISREATNSETTTASRVATSSVEDITAIISRKERTVT